MCGVPSSSVGFPIFVNPMKNTCYTTSRNIMIERMKKVMYPKVSEFLRHVVTNTRVHIFDGSNHVVYFEGIIKDYLTSEIKNEPLTLLQSFICDNILHIEAIKENKEEHDRGEQFVEILNEIGIHTIQDIPTSSSPLKEQEGVWIIKG